MHDQLFGTQAARIFCLNPPGALNAIFSGVPIFLEAFAPLSVELQRGNPSTGANVRDVNSVRRCVVCTSAPGLF